MPKYLKLISIQFFCFFVFSYSTTVQADIDKVYIEDIVDDVSKVLGKTIEVPGFILSYTHDQYPFYAYKSLGLGIVVNGDKLSKKQKKWIHKNCELKGDPVKNGCYVNVTGVVTPEEDGVLGLDAVEVKKMGMKDKLIHIALGEKKKLEGTVDLIKEVYE
jgi:hypothetical protein